jgi:hypothetical protein
MTLISSASYEWLLSRLDNPDFLYYVVHLLLCDEPASIAVDATNGMIGVNSDTWIVQGFQNRGATMHPLPKMPISMRIRYRGECGYSIRDAISEQDLVACIATFRQTVSNITEPGA